MKKLKEIYEESKSAVVGIHFFDKNKDDIVGSGTGFVLEDYLITNYHVVAKALDYANSGDRNFDIIISYDNTVKRRTDSTTDFKNISKGNCNILCNNLITSSDENNHDYAIFKKDGIINLSDDFLERGDINQLNVGDEVAFLGYPFGSFNICLHTGIISSIYDSGIAKVLQLDARTNKGNSGGPVLDIETGKVIGIITRKEDGFTKGFEQLEETLEGNVIMFEKCFAGSNIIMGSINYIHVMKAQQQQLLKLCSELKRSANVGIGYAHTITPIIQEIDRCKEVEFVD